MFVNFIFLILLFFVPLSFAATEPWAFFIFQLMVSFIFLYLLYKKNKFCFSFPAVMVFSSFIFLIIIALIQLLNHHTITQVNSLLLFTASPFHTLNELNSIFTYMMLFFVSLQLFDRFEKIKKLLYVLMIVSSLVMIIGLCFPNGEYIKFFLGNSSLGNFGPFTNRNNAGTFLSMSFFIFVSVIFYTFIKYKKYIMQNKKKEFVTVQTINITLSLMLLLSVVLTRSRGAMAATFLSIFVFLFLYFYFFSNGLKTRFIKLTTVFLFFVISCFIIYKNIDAINAYSRRTGGLSEQTRVELYKMSLDILKDFPITGVGLAAFQVTVDKYFEKELKAYPQYLHSDWLELVTGIGYPLAVMMFFAFFILISTFLKRIKFLSDRKKIFLIGLLSAIISISLASSVDFHFHIPANAVLFIICLSVLCSLSFYKNEKNINLKLNIFFKMLFFIFVVGLMCFSFKNVISWRYYTFAKNMPKQQQLEYYKNAAFSFENPKYMENYIISEYNYCLKNKSLFNGNEKEIAELSYEYLKKYPFNKKISKIYSVISLNNKSY